MFQKLNLSVQHLHRTEFATICLEELQEGKWKHLTTDEVQRLRKLISVPISK